MSTSSSGSSSFLASASAGAAPPAAAANKNENGVKYLDTTNYLLTSSSSGGTTTTSGAHLLGSFSNELLASLITDSGDENGKVFFVSRGTAFLEEFLNIGSGYNKRAKLDICN
jgi:hypothetical protein